MVDSELDCGPLILPKTCLANGRRSVNIYIYIPFVTKMGASSAFIFYYDGQVLLPRGP